jgi:hypothetical protein
MNVSRQALQSISICSNQVVEDTLNRLLISVRPVELECHHPQT